MDESEMSLETEKQKTEVTAKTEKNLISRSRKSATEMSTIKAPTIYLIASRATEINNYELRKHIDGKSLPAHFEQSRRSIRSERCLGRYYKQSTGLSEEVNLTYLKTLFTGKANGVEGELAFSG